MKQLGSHQSSRRRAPSVTRSGQAGGTRVRKPGQGFELTDEEILVTPLKLLTKQQRARRRTLKREAEHKRQAAKKAERNRRIEEKGLAKVKYCQGFKKNGDACMGYAVEGAKHCIAHLNEAEKAKLGKQTPAEVRRENRLDPTNIRSGPATARALMEVALEKILSRYFHALGLEFVGFDTQNQPVIIDHGESYGLRMFGESKEGDVYRSEHPDLMGQIQVAEKLWDRIYGKPRQTQVLEGGVRPIQIQPVRQVERAKQVANILQRTGALPHEGRRRSLPPTEEEVVETGGKVIPLNDTIKSDD